MSWRSRVSQKLAAGEYKQKTSAMDSFAAGFMSSYPTAIAEQTKADALKAKEAAEKLKEQEEKDEEQKQLRKNAQQMAIELFGNEAGKAPSVVNSVYDALNARAGDYDATFQHLERTYKGNTLKLETPSVPSVMSTFESGTGGYDALLNQSQTGQFSDVKVSQMTMDEVLAFSAIDGDYHRWSKDNVPEGTYAYENGLGATPMGAYQFVGSTLRRIQKAGGFEELGIDGNTKFDKETQDSLFVWLANDALNGKKTDGEKIEAMRGVWEGLKNAPESEILELISEVETGTFMESKPDPDGPRLTSTPITELQEEFKLEFKGIDSMQKLREYKAEIIGNDIQLNQNQLTMMSEYETYLITEEAKAGKFDFVEFLKDENVSSNATIRNAITIIENVEASKLHEDPKKAEELRQDYITQLQGNITANQEEKAKQALANKEDVYVYKFNSDGTLNTMHETLRYDSASDSYVDIRGNKVDLNDPMIATITSNDESIGATLRTYNTSIREVSTYQGQAEAAVKQLISLRQTVETSPEAFNSILKNVSKVVGTAENLEEAFRTAIDQGGTYQDVERAVYSKFSDIQQSDRIVFSKMLRAAYDMAALKGSRGQGLSDKELMQNLEALGYGATKAEIALGAINTAFSDLFSNAESRRSGLFNAIQAPELLAQSFAKQPWGVPIEQSVVANLNDAELAQLEKARSGETKVSNQTTTKPDQTVDVSSKLNAAFDKVSQSGQSIGQLLKRGMAPDALESIVKFYVGKGFDEELVRNEISQRIRESSR